MYSIENSDEILNDLQENIKSLEDNYDSEKIINLKEKIILISKDTKYSSNSNFKECEKNLYSLEKKRNLYEFNKLKEITGIGISNAKKLLENNITFTKLYNEIENNIELQNSSYLKILTHSQYIGLKYYSDFQKKIPREEIHIFQKILKNISENISEKLKFVICGSFRRKSYESKDIEIILLYPDYKEKKEIDNNKNYLECIINEMKNKNLIIDSFVNTFKTKYNGVCKINNIARKIEIRYVPFNSFIPSILHFTGSWSHTISLRNIANKQNYKLNEYGFFKLDENNKETEIILKSEKELYDILGLEYILPKDR